MLSLQPSQYDEIKHSVLVLCKRTFGIVIFTDNFLCVGYNLFNGKLLETLVPFLQCLNGDGGGFLPVYLHVAKFGFCLSHFDICLYPALFLFTVEFFHLSGVFLVFLFKGLYRLFILCRFGELLLLRCYGCFGKFPCRHVVIEIFDFMPFLVQFLECRVVTASVIRSGDHQLWVGFQKFLRFLCHMRCVLGFQTFAVGTMSASVMLGKKVIIRCVVYTRLTFRLVELVLFKVGGIAFLKMLSKKVQCVSRPIISAVFLEVFLVNVFLDIGFIGAYFLGYADGDCFIVQQFTDRRIQFVQFQTGIDILFTPSETADK